MSAALRNTLTSISDVADGAPSSTAQPSRDSQALLSSLGHLVRGLSAQFWGLPIGLIVCVQTAKTDWLQPLGFVPPILALGLLYFALTQIGHFQRQERIWRVALDRAKIFSVINLGLSPFLFWSNRMPGNPFFTATVELMTVTALLYLFTINMVLRRLAAMLPDETLRIETAVFTKMNNYLLFATGLVFGSFFILRRFENFPRLVMYIFSILDHGGIWVLLFMILLPIAMTMALIWKIKEVIFASVFNGEVPGRVQ
jgi:hypothetical protein